MSIPEHSSEVRETVADVSSVAAEMVDASLEERETATLQTLAERERDRASLWQDPSGFMNDQAEGFRSYGSAVVNNARRGGELNLIEPNGSYGEAAIGSLAPAAVIGGLVSTNFEDPGLFLATAGGTAALMTIEGGAASQAPRTGGPIRRILEPATETVLFTGLDSIPRGGYNLARGLGMTNMDAMIAGGGTGLAGVGYAIYRIVRFTGRAFRSAEVKRAERLENEAKLDQNQVVRFRNALNHNNARTLEDLHEKLGDNLLRIMGLAGLGGLLRANPALKEMSISSTTFEQTRAQLLDESNNGWIGRRLLFRGGQESAVNTADVRGKFLQEFSTWVDGPTHGDLEGREVLSSLALATRASDTVTGRLQDLANRFRDSRAGPVSLTVTPREGNPITISEVTGRAFRVGDNITPQNIHERFAGNYSNGELRSGFEFSGDSNGDRSFLIGYHEGKYYLREEGSGDNPTREISDLSFV